ncbi:hypothetical protein WJX73_002720 [Symbiochloris irregularis]|uniref:Vesicle transport protein n=1 Tax=Symbiochloris irregularis TaxID=706552 RepID=A0AAW1P3D1_9CHLO
MWAFVKRYTSRSSSSTRLHARSARLFRNVLELDCTCVDLAGDSVPCEPWTPTAKAAAFTGLYILAAGVALLLAPGTIFGLLFSARDVSTTYLRVGGTLCVLFGMYYLGAVTSRPDKGF